MIDLLRPTTLQGPADRGRQFAASATAAAPAAQSPVNIRSAAKPAKPSAAGADEKLTTGPTLQEFVDVATARVDRGGYRITKTVAARQQIVEQSLRRRRVTVERLPLGVLLPEGCDMPEPHREGDVLVIPVVEEVLVTTTRLRIVEEVHVTIVDGSDRSAQPVTLRRQTVRIDRLDADPSAAGS